MTHKPQIILSKAEAIRLSELLLHLPRSTQPIANEIEDILSKGETRMTNWKKR